MRVEVVFELQEPGDKVEPPGIAYGPDTGVLDLRDNPEALDPLEEPRLHPPLRSFLAAVNSTDSLFSAVRCRTWLAPAALAPGATTEQEPTGAACAFASQVELIFAQESWNFARNRYEDLTRRLQELLTREASAEAMRAELRVRPFHSPGAERWGFCLVIVLHAPGDTPERAELRWGLGLARVQQALLFISRVLRQQSAQASKADS